MLGLLPERIHHFRAEDSLGESGIIFHIGRDRQLPPWLDPLEDKRMQICAARIERGGKSRRPRADNDNPVMVVHGSFVVLNRSPALMSSPPSHSGSCPRALSVSLDFSCTG